MSYETIGGILHTSLRDAQARHFSMLPTKRYRESYMTNDVANTITWEEFKRRSNPTLVTQIPGSNLDALLVPKSRTWSGRDINIFAGASNKNLRAYNDFDTSDFAATFGWHIDLAKAVGQHYGETVNVTHGFNPEDTAPDAHSLYSKFHTHVYIPERDTLKPGDIRGLPWFDKLKLIEPYAQVFWDFAKAHFAKEPLPEGSSLQENLGFFSIETPLQQVDRAYWEQMYKFLKQMGRGYESVVDIFTDRREENLTSHKRFIPRPLAERTERMEEFLAKNQKSLSEQSAKLLRTLNRAVKPAEPRTSPRSTDVHSAGQLWLAKGLSGAMNFVVNPDADTMRFDFAPRIISSSGATKILSTEPAIVIKDAGDASAGDIEKLQEYEATISRLAKTVRPQTKGGASETIFTRRPYAGT